jgi:protein SCO1/2
MKILIVVLLFTFACSAFADQKIPAELQGVDIEQHLNTQIPLDLRFNDETGKEVRFGDLLQGKPAILTLVYYECPMLCTQVLNGLITSLRPISFTPGDQFNIITVSFNPRETPSLAAAKKASYLKDYAREGAERGWFFLTGSQESIAKLTDTAGFRYKYDPKINQYAHSTAIMLLTPDGRIARYFFGIEYPSKDLRLSLVEASQHQIGTIADKVLLFCFHYDPSQGRYSATILNIIRAGGILTILLIGGSILLMRRKERSNHV